MLSIAKALRAFFLTASYLNTFVFLLGNLTNLSDYSASLVLYMRICIWHDIKLFTYGFTCVLLTCRQAVLFYLRITHALHHSSQCFSGLPLNFCHLFVLASKAQPIRQVLFVWCRNMADEEGLFRVYMCNFKWDVNKKDQLTCVYNLALMFT